MEYAFGDLRHDIGFGPSGEPGGDVGAPRVNACQAAADSPAVPMEPDNKADITVGDPVAAQGEAAGLLRNAAIPMGRPILSLFRTASCWAPVYQL